MKHAIAILALGVLAGCGPAKTVTVCNWTDERDIYVGGDINVDAVRDERTGCRFLKNGNRGSITHDGQPCWGPRVCRTVDRAQWEAQHAQKEESHE